MWTLFNYFVRQVGPFKGSFRSRRDISSFCRGPGLDVAKFQENVGCPLEVTPLQGGQSLCTSWRFTPKISKTRLEARKFHWLSHQGDIFKNHPIWEIKAIIKKTVTQFAFPKFFQVNLSTHFLF